MLTEGLVALSNSQVLSLLALFMSIRWWHSEGLGEQTRDDIRDALTFQKQRSVPEKVQERGIPGTHVNPVPSHMLSPVA